ncbi:MAG: aldo/keto reductase [Rhodobacteraceae bacterium]|nr:aldo/keto reductase [Paracoccaceae bacterium]
MAALNQYRTLGASGLRVSPICLGTMLFGPRGTSEPEANRQLDAYAGKGGNFVDTAIMYGAGASEEIVGRALKGRRDKFVVSTKFSFMFREGDANSGGNARRNIVQSIETSLKRLQTDYIDLYYLHFWDGRTKIEETMRALDDAVRAGKILYLACSNIPAWKVAEANTFARANGLTPFSAYQGQYNLVERTCERDIIPMGMEHGVTLVPYSPLAQGLLSGKYSRADAGPPADGPGDGTRKSMLQRLGHINERSLAIIDTVNAVAKENKCTPSQVALAWILTRPGRPLPVIGARTFEHYQDNIGCLDVDLNEDQLARLEKVSAFDLGYPHQLLSNARFTVNMGDAGVHIEGGWRERSMK